jgi:glycosyltransferase involved in cell wall biosynthesis
MDAQSMRVLWFVNTVALRPGGDDVRKLRSSGGWLLALAEQLVQVRDLRLAIVAPGRVRQTESYSSAGVDCFVVPDPTHATGRGEAQALRRCVEVVERWRPDLVHVHGTEMLWGLLSAKALVKQPVAISIQGVLGPYSQWCHYFGTRSLSDILRMHRWFEPAVARGQIWAWWRYKRGALREERIVRGNRHFMGRTSWDRAHVIALNPEARYYHVGELLRTPFWEGSWDINTCQRHRVIFTNAGHPRKGTEVLLEAASLLAPGYPELEVCVAGGISHRSGYGRYIRREMRKLGFVKEMGPLNASEMVREACRSHVFVSPSLIDNSPNAVCEAQLMGMPVVASYTGGVPSLVAEGGTGLFFPKSDAASLAARLREIFEDDNLATELGRAARTVARKRHDPDAVTKQLIDAYEAILMSSAS